MRALTAFALLALAGCAATPLAPGASDVRITKTEPPAECRFLGDITGSQGDFFRGAFTANPTLETGARNDLKNRASELGGNLVVLLTERAGNSGSFGDNGGFQQTNVTLSGNVYACPESLVRTANE